MTMRASIETLPFSWDVFRFVVHYRTMVLQYLLTVAGIELSVHSIWLTSVRDCD